jgi:endoglucanase
MMKKLIFICLAIFCLETAAQTLFSKGVNLTNWFQASSPQGIHFTKYTREDFSDIKSLGVDVIRLPINLHSMTLGAPEYELDPLFLDMLDDVVDWAEEFEINLILDNHTFDPAIDTEPTVYGILKPVWQNMAEHFKDRSDLLYYEILNEPHGIDDNIWNIIQQAVVKDIRQIDSVHTIVVGPAGWNSYHNLDLMPIYEDDNLIYTFHFYDPFLFTHQGASWTDPSMVSLSDVPFPYNASAMPPFPSDLEGTWVQSTFNNYNNDGTVARVHELLDIAVKFQEERNVQLLCGEFGVFHYNSPEEDRTNWYGVIRDYLEENGIAWTIWDYHGAFGIYERNSDGIFDHDLNVPLLEALGLNVPPQSEFVMVPDSVKIPIYSDFVESGINGYSGGNLSFYSTPAKTGSYNIEWTATSQYNSIGFDFVPNRDLSYLADNNFVVGFWLKSSNTNIMFDIRFIDTKEHILEQPWRNTYTINNNVLLQADQWQYIEIPLTSFSETGSWDNGVWYNPMGLFEWSKIDRFEIVNEHDQITNINLSFDEIKIYDPSVTNVEEIDLPNSYTLLQNYPNPFNPATTIEYSINSSLVENSVSLKIYDILGNEIETLVNEKQVPGNYSVVWDASNYSSGLYFYILKTDKIQVNKKMILLK